MLRADARCFCVCRLVAPQKVGRRAPQSTTALLPVPWRHTLPSCYRRRRHGGPDVPPHDPHNAGAGAADLLQAVDQAVREGKARSRNEFVATALRHELAAQERMAIDAAFAGMAEDPAYQAAARAISAEFATADWEALRRAEVEQ
jgi:hypothetical protein